MILEFFRGSTQFWAPIALLWGLAILLAGVTYIVILKRYKWIGWTNIGFGIAFILLSFFINPSFDKQYWSSLLLRFSLPVFFFGITFTRTQLKKGWLIILIGLVFLVYGYVLAPK